MSIEFQTLRSDTRWRAIVDTIHSRGSLVAGSTFDQSVVVGKVTKRDTNQSDQKTFLQTDLFSRLIHLKGLPQDYSIYDFYRLVERDQAVERKLST